MKAIYFLSGIISCTVLFSFASCKKDTMVSYNDSDLHYIQRYESTQAKLSDTAMAISYRFFKSREIDTANTIVYSLAYYDECGVSINVGCYKICKGLRVYPYNCFWETVNYDGIYLSSSFWNESAPEYLDVNDIKLDTTAKLKAFGAVKLFVDKVNNEGSSIETKRTIMFDTIIVKFGYYALLNGDRSVLYTKCWMVKTEGDVFALAFINDDTRDFIKFKINARLNVKNEHILDSY